LADEIGQLYRLADIRLRHYANKLYEMCEHVNKSSNAKRPLIGEGGRKILKRTRRL